MSVSAYPTLRLQLSMPQALKLQFLPAIPGSNASAAADRAARSATEAQAAADVAVAATVNKVDRAGDVMTGFLTANADPTALLHYATKQYVDLQSAGAVLGAEYITATANAALTNERVLTNTATITWDFTTPGEAKATSVAGGGNVSTSGSPTAGQYSKWVTPTTIQGVAAATVLSDIGALSMAAAAAAYQPLDGDLTALAALTGTNTLYFRAAANTWNQVTIGTGLSFNAGILASTSTAALSGQSYLSKSGANLLLAPFDGNKLIINGVQETIPDAGVTLAPTSLAINTTFYIYAFMSAGTMTLEASATGHSKQAGTGVEIKTGDATRSLVGMARTITGPAWVDTDAQRQVLSWFNRKIKAGRGTSAGGSTSALSFVEINVAARWSFLTWVDEAVNLGAGGFMSNANGGNSVYIELMFDGVAENVFGLGTSAVATYAFPATVLCWKSGLSEGFHYGSYLGRVDGSTGSYNSMIVHGMVRG